MPFECWKGLSISEGGSLAKRIKTSLRKAVRCFGYGLLHCFRQDLQHPEAVVPAFCREHVFPRSWAAESLRHLLGRGLEMGKTDLSTCSGAMPFGWPSEATFCLAESPNPKALAHVVLFGHRLTMLQSPLQEAFVSARLPAEAVVQAGSGLLRLHRVVFKT